MIASRCSNVVASGVASFLALGNIVPCPNLIVSKELCLIPEITQSALSSKLVDFAAKSDTPGCGIFANQELVQPHELIFF